MYDFAKGFLQFTMYGGQLLGVAVGLVDGNEDLVHLVHRLVHPGLNGGRSWSDDARPGKPETEM